MKLIKLGAAVLNQVPLDWPGNTSRICAAIGEAPATCVESIPPLQPLFLELNPRAGS